MARRGVRRGTGATLAMARARRLRWHGRGVRDGTGAQCDLAASDSEIQGSAASISLKFRTVVLSRVLRLVGRAWFNAPGSLASWRPPRAAGCSLRGRCAGGGPARAALTERKA